MEPALARRGALGAGPRHSRADESDRVDGTTDIVAALRGLPPRQRAAVVLRYFEDLTEVQTAAVLGCSVGTVKSQTARGLAKLRVVLDPGGGPGADDARGGTRPTHRPPPSLRRTP